MKYKVNFINNSFRRYYQKRKEELNQAFVRCMENGDFVLRQDVDEFEKKLSEYTGSRYAVAVNSGTDALKLAIEALALEGEWEDGDEIITVSHVFIAPIQEIVHARFKPVLVDVEEDTCVMDIAEVKKAITPKTRAILPVHLSGVVVDILDLYSMLKEIGRTDIKVIEDACQALGSIQYGRIAGNMGDIGTYSFISPKMMGGWGDNGAVVTNNKDLYEKILLLRNHWNITQNALLGVQLPHPEVMYWGHNTRMDNIQAAMLNVKFQDIEWIIFRRKEVAERYIQGLQGLPINLPSRKEGETWQEFIIRPKDREKFKEFMDEKGVELLIRDTTPNHKLTGYELLDCELPITELLAKEQARLPLYPELTDEEVDYVIESVKEFYA